MVKFGSPANYKLCAEYATKITSLLYSNKSRSPCEPASNQSKSHPSCGNLIFRNLRFAHSHHWGSRWLWRNLILLNLRFAHPRHLGLWLWRI
jgi:hypothetical protein